MRHAVTAILFLLLAACTPVTHPLGPPVMPPAYDGDHLTMADGARLPLRTWQPPAPERAVLVALHGMNDYSNFFDSQGRYLAWRGIACYAYDQRGFGQGPHPGEWSSTEAMAADAAATVELVAARHPGVPLFVLGESMGGAVLMAMEARGLTPKAVRGLILSAPAVWGRDAMPWYQNLALWLSYHIAPDWRPSGQGLNIRPSDNIDMLIKLGQDPLVIKETRVDAVKGLVDLMDEAYLSASALSRPALLLYGEKDEVIPMPPTRTVVASLPDLGHAQRVALYPDGWHMLTRDLQAQTVLDDIAAWIRDQSAPLPSGADANAVKMIPGG
jgi:alpha-beta hydrolase superfamily lysophospholipase